MLVTLEWMRRKYIDFTQIYFNGDMPNISFKISNSTKTWGYASYTYNLKNNTVIPISITLSNYYDSDENVKETTMLHEMIHILDYYHHPEHFVSYHKRVRGYDPHGYIFFLSEARRIENESGGKYHIEKYVTEEEKSLSSISDENMEKLKIKAQAGCLLCIFELNNIRGNRGYEYGYVKSKYPRYDDFISYVIKKSYSWYSTYVNKIYFYDCHDPKICGERAKSNGYKLLKDLNGIDVGKLITVYDVKNDSFVNDTNNTNNSEVTNEPIEKPVELSPVAKVINDNIELISKYVYRKIINNDNDDERLQFTLTLKKANATINFYVGLDFTSHLDENKLYLSIDPVNYNSLDNVAKEIKKAIVMKESKRLEQIISETIKDVLKQNNYDIDKDPMVQQIRGDEEEGEVAIM